MLGGDLIPKPARHISGRPDKHNPHLSAQIGERGVFRHETPSHPDRICTRGCKRLFEPLVVEIAILRSLRIWIGELRGAEKHRLIRFADEHRAAVGLREECDGAKWYAVLMTELPCRVDETHGSFAAIDNGNALEFVLHKRLCETIVVLSRRALSHQNALS